MYGRIKIMLRYTIAAQKKSEPAKQEKKEKKSTKK